jgi:hypothetical protein
MSAGSVPGGGPPSSCRCGRVVERLAPTARVEAPQGAQAFDGGAGGGRLSCRRGTTGGTGRLTGGLLVGLVVVLGGLLGAGSATPAVGVSARQLALMPLPLAGFGGRVYGLGLAPGSGVVTDADSALNANGTVSASELARLGQESGYLLDFGVFGGPEPVSEAETTVELYGSDAAARRALGFWRSNEIDVGALRATGIRISFAPFAVAALGGGSFAEVGRYALEGARTLFLADVCFRSGRIVADAGITASSPALARGVDVAAALRLRARIRGVLSGRIGGAPVAVPGPLRPGPPPGGPDPASLALTAGELGGRGPAAVQGYEPVGRGALSKYVRELSLSGSLGRLSEQVIVYANATLARFLMPASAGSGSAESMWRIYVPGDAAMASRPRLVRLRAGSQARAVLGALPGPNGRGVDAAFIVLRLGRTMEIIGVGAALDVRLRPSAVARLAAIAARQAARATRSHTGA